MYLLAVDPGLNGAACILRTHGSLSVLNVIDLPKRSDGSNDQINVPMLTKWLRGFRIDFAVVENVQPMPSIAGKNGERRSMGSASAFRFGIAVGQIRSCIETLDIPLGLVVPFVWKKHFGLSGPDKAQSIDMVKQLLPSAAGHLTRAKHHQRAEAILIALYAASEAGQL